LNLNSQILWIVDYGKYKKKWIIKSNCNKPQIIYICIILKSKKLLDIFVILETTMNEFVCFVCVLSIMLYVCVQVVSNGFESYENIGEV
jgi:hypothetical protein